MSNINSIEYANEIAHPRLRRQANTYEKFGQKYHFSATFTIPVDGVAVGEHVKLFELPAGAMPIDLFISTENLSSPAANVFSIGTIADPNLYWSSRAIGIADGPSHTLAAFNLPTGVAGAGTQPFPVVLEVPTVIILTVRTNPWVAGKKGYFTANVLIGSN